MAALVKHEAIIQTLLRQQLTDRLQFPSTFRGGLGICHLKFFERIKDNPGNNQPGILLDRKSTRLNSSHLVISYAVFCLKKKQNKYPEYTAYCPKSHTRHPDTHTARV